MSRLEKAPSTGETNTNTVNTMTTKTSGGSHNRQQYPRITVPKGLGGATLTSPTGTTLHTANGYGGEGTLLQVVDKNGNRLEPKLAEGHPAEVVWARKQLFQKNKRGTTIPSNLAIPVGLAQIAVGASMAILGVLAIRYQSYLFYYGSGLWTGMVVGITGALCAMCTKSGLPKPKWFCGGQRWQVHVLLGCTMLSLSASVLLAIFSTAGLLQTAKTMVGVEMADKTDDDETFERRRSAGNIINSLLLLASMLEVLLSFSTFGMAISVLCKSSYKPSLLSSTGSSGSENQPTRDILASTTEYQARKDRLLRWLGHQPRRAFPGLPQPRGTLRPYVIPAQSMSSSYMIPGSASRPVFTLPPNYPTSITIPHPAYSIIMPMPAPPPVPIVPLPMRRATTPASHSHAAAMAAAKAAQNGQLLLVPDDLRMKHHFQQQQQIAAAQHHLQQQHQQQQQLMQQHRSRNSSVSNLSVATRRSSKCSVASSSKVGSLLARRICDEKNKEVEITEEEVSKTYTGLDRTVAEDFIAHVMSERKIQTADIMNLNNHDNTCSSSTANLINDSSSSSTGTESAGNNGDEEDDIEEVEEEEEEEEEAAGEEEPEQEISRL